MQALQEGRISAGHARCLLSFTAQEDTLLAFLDYILAGNLSVRDCEDLIAAAKAGQPFPWQDENAVPIPLAKPRTRMPKSPVFKQLEKDLASALHCKAKISGSNEKGKVTLHYKNEEELQALLSALGMTEALEAAIEANAVQAESTDSPEKELA